MATPFPFRNQHSRKENKIQKSKHLNMKIQRDLGGETEELEFLGKALPCPLPIKGSGV